MNFNSISFSNASEAKASKFQKELRIATSVEKKWKRASKYHLYITQILTARCLNPHKYAFFSQILIFLR